MGARILRMALTIGCPLVTNLASADYLLILKNGRQITVQSYREEGSMIKFQGFGGEIGISKDQLQTIRNLGSEAAAGLDVTAPQQPSGLPEKAPETAQPPPLVSDKSLSPEEERAREEKEYQQKLIDVNERLKNAQDRYSQAIRGTTSSEPSLLTTEEQLKARTDDIISRSLDAQYNPTEPAGTKLVTPSPFSSLPPTVTEVSPPGVPKVTGPLPPYTERQKELSDLRSQTLQLEKDRERLIEEMKQKNFDSVKLLEQ